jgi:hypothetical protein
VAVRTLLATPLQENLTHFHTRIRVSQMLLIDALRNALSVRLGTTQHTEAMRRTVTEYTYIRPD